MHELLEEDDMPQDQAAKAEQEKQAQQAEADRKAVEQAEKQPPAPDRRETKG